MRMKNILRGSILLLVILIISCGKSNQQVDNFLDDYEKVVEKWEASIADGEFTEEDSDEMNKIIEEMEDKAKKLQNVTKWNKKQQERYAKLTERIMDAIFKSMNIPGGFSF
jgi:DNA-binding transcriptional regulator GbsR (MarR family)